MAYTKKDITSALKEVKNKTKLPLERLQEIGDRFGTEAAKEPLETPEGYRARLIAHLEQLEKGDTDAERAHMATYMDIVKGRYEDAIVLLKCGDFYETLDADAKIVSRECGTVLSKFGKRPLTAIASHSLETALQKLVKAGHRVAICDDWEKEPAIHMHKHTQVTPATVPPATAIPLKLKDLKPTDKFRYSKTGTEYRVEEVKDGKAFIRNLNRLDDPQGAWWIKKDSEMERPVIKTNG